MPEDPLRVLLIGNYKSKFGHTPPVGESLEVDLRSLGVKCFHGGEGASSVKRILDMLSKILFKRHEYDIVVLDVFSGRAFQWASWMSKATHLVRKKLIAVLHGGNLPEFSEQNPGKYQNFAGQCDKIIAPSDYLADWSSSLGFPAKVVPNHLDLNQYINKNRQEFSPKLFWLRRFHPLYNPLLALKCLKELIKTSPEANLWMAGPDSGELKVCQDWVKQEQLEKHVRFLGRLSKEEIVQVGQERDIFLNTPHIDNTPVTVMEAAAMGLPIVSTKVGGMPKILREGEEILLIEDHQPVDMAKAVQSLLDHPTKAVEMHQKASQRAKQWDWAEVGPQWLNILEEVNSK